MNDDEDLIYDQTLLLRKETKPSGYSKWCGKFTKTLCLSLAFFSLGLCIAIPGPTLLDLGDKVNTDTTHMALIFSARSVGYLLGALIGGFLFDIFNKQLLLTATLFIASVATLIIPWSLTLVVLAVMFSLQGVAMGVLDTGGNVFCVRLWGSKSPPYMQALHFAFGIGAFIAPLIAQPFLSTTNSTSNSLLQGSVPVLSNSSYLETFLNHNNTHVQRTQRDLHDMPPDKKLNVSKVVFNEDNFTVSVLNLTTYIPKTTTSTTPIPKKPSKIDGSFLQNTHQDGGQISNHLKNNHVIDDLQEEKVTPSSVITTTTNLTINPLKNDEDTVDTSKRLDKSNKTDDLPTDENSERLSDNITVSNATQAEPTMENSIPPPKSSIVETTNKSTSPISATIPSKTTSRITTTTSTTTTTTTTPTPSTTTTTPTTTTTTPTTTTTTPSTTTTTLSTTTTTPTTATTTPTTTTTTPTSKTTTTPKLTPPPVNLENHTAMTEPENSTLLISTTTVHKPLTVGDLFSSMLDSVKNMSRIQFAYSIIAVLLFINSTLFLVLYCFTKTKRSEEDNEDFNEVSMHAENNCVRIITLVFSFFFFMCYVGMETTFGGLIMTFAVEYAHWTKKQGAIVTAIFWGSLATGRGFAIFISHCCKSRTMLIIDFLFMLTGTLILAFGVQRLDILLWLGTIFLGIGLSSIFPTSVTWIEQYFKITGKSTAVFVTGSAIGQMTLPVITGYLYQNYHKQYLMYTILSLSVLTIILYIIMQCLASRATAKFSSGFLRLDDLDTDMQGYSSTQDPARRKFMPVHNGYDLLMQDAEEEF